MTAEPKPPLVSVIIPAYNAEAFIGRTLASVLAQTYAKLEIIVVDDGSTDGTAEIARSFAQKDERVRLLQKPNGGVASARNLGIRQSKGAFIAPIDADDIWYPANIEKQVQCMQQGGPRVGLVYSWSVDIDEADRPLGTVHAASIEGEVFTTLLVHNFIANASCTMLRRVCLDKVGLYDPSYKARQAQGCEDWDLYLRMAECYHFQVVPDFLVGYRKLDNSMSGNATVMARSLSLIWEATEQKYPRPPAMVKCLSLSSFYIYLAHESHRTGKHPQTWAWLRKALQAGRFTPLLRPYFYVLALKSWRAQRSSAHRRPKPKTQKVTAPLTLEALRRRQKRRLKPVAEQLLHRIARRVLGRPEGWV